MAIPIVMLLVAFSSPRALAAEGVKELTRLDNAKKALKTALAIEDLDNRISALSDVLDKYTLDESGLLAYQALCEAQLKKAQNDKTVEINGKIIDAVKFLREIILDEAQTNENESGSDEVRAAYALAAYSALEMQPEYNALRNRLVTAKPGGLVASVCEWYELREIFGAVADKMKRSEMCVEFFVNHPEHKYAHEALYGFRDAMYETDNLALISSECERIVIAAKGAPFASFLVASIYIKKNTDVQKALELSMEAYKRLKTAGVKPAEEPSEKQENTLDYHSVYFFGTYILGKALIAAGSPDNAVEFLNKAKEESADDSNMFYVIYRYLIYRGLGEAYEALGKRFDAMDAYYGVLQNRGTDKVRDEAEEKLAAIYGKIAGTTSGLRRYFAKKAGFSMPLFTDVSREMRLENAVVTGSDHVAWGDYDGDGFEDLLLSGTRLFKNLGGWRFQDVTAKAGIVHRGTCGIFLDYDGDGDLDIFAGGDNADYLLRNDGKGRFTDVSTSAGITGTFQSTEGIGAADFNGDGWLDVYIVKRPPWGNEGVPSPDFLFINNGNGSFTDASVESGIRLENWRFGRGIACADFDNDGDQDIFVANYRLQKNFLWRNDGKGHFINEAAQLGLEGNAKPAPTGDPEKFYYGHTIGGVWGDLDGDLDLDIFQANLCHPDYRFVYSDLPQLCFSLGNEGGWKFENRLKNSGIKFEETHSGPSLCDFDGDGDLDLYITSVYENMPSFLYQNDSAGRFKDVSWCSGTVAMNGWGAAWCDFDNDGDMDLAVATGGGLKLFRNDAKGLKYLKIRLKGAGGNKQAIGARVIVEAGGKKYLRELCSSTGNGNQDSSVLYFGLGAYEGKVNVQVRWPDGANQFFTDVETSRPAPLILKQIKRGPPEPGD